MLSGTANSMQAIASEKCGITRQNKKAPKAAEGRSVRESTVFRRESTISCIDTHFSEMV